jgi:hypothetical protein
VRRILHGQGFAGRHVEDRQRPQVERGIGLHARHLLGGHELREVAAQPGALEVPFHPRERRAGCDRELHAPPERALDCFLRDVEQDHAILIIGGICKLIIVQVNIMNDRIATRIRLYFI